MWNCLPKEFRVIEKFNFQDSYKIVMAQGAAAQSADTSNVLSVVLN